MSFIKQLNWKLDFKLFRIKKLKKSKSQNKKLCLN